MAEERWEADLNSKPTQIIIDLEDGEVADVSYFFGTTEPWGEQEFEPGSLMKFQMEKFRVLVKHHMIRWKVE